MTKATLSATIKASFEARKIEKSKLKEKKKVYFGSDVQQKIIEFQAAEKEEEKERIYTDYIHPAFTNLVNSLVAVYNFKSSNEDIEHLKHDCVVFLFENIYKWNPEKGTKAFSYYNVVAKNWLTIQSRRLLKHARRNAYIDDEEGLTSQEKSEIFDRVDSDFDEIHESLELRVKRAKEIIDFVEIHLKDENDTKCVHAIKKLYEELDNVEIFNKRSIFVYLREISGLNGPELSMSLSNIRKIYRKNKSKNKKFDLEDVDMLHEDFEVK